MKYPKIERIIENIFDVICKTGFYTDARTELDKDLRNHNITLDRKGGCIEIQDTNGIRTLYTITITKN